MVAWSYGASPGRSQRGAGLKPTGNRRTAEKEFLRGTNRPALLRGGPIGLLRELNKHPTIARRSRRRRWTTSMSTVAAAQEPTAASGLVRPFYRRHVNPGSAERGWNHAGGIGDSERTLYRTALLLKAGFPRSPSQRSEIPAVARYGANGRTLQSRGAWSLSMPGDTVRRTPPALSGPGGPTQ